MTQVQFRRYQIAPGEMDAFLDHWKHLVPVREKYGFTVLFAYADRNHNEFLWAVGHDGDFDAAHEAYETSAERAAVVDGVVRRMVAHHVAKVEPVEV